MSRTLEKAKTLILSRGGTIRTRDALAAGIHPRTLYSLRESGEIVRLGRGLFRVADLPPVGDPDLALVAGRVPHAVVCLVSALAIHELTTQIPHRVHVAIPRTSRYPVLDAVPLAVYRFSRSSFEAGIEHIDIGGATIRIYNAETTIADCFKYRNKIGLDVTLEAVALYKHTPGASLQRILEYARTNRVLKAIRPYLEALA